MSKSNTISGASERFSEYVRLAYWIAGKWSRRVLDCTGRGHLTDELDELTHDAVCRGWSRFLQRYERTQPTENECRAWVAQCMRNAVRDTLRAKSRFGSISSHVAVRDDVMNRRYRTDHVMADGTDTMPQVPDSPVAYEPQQWELEKLAEEKLPEHLRETAVYAALGMTHAESAALQGITDRTVRRRLAEIREHLRGENSK